MHHILLSFGIIALSLVVSVKRNGATIGFLTLSWIPTALLLGAILSEKALGFKRFPEVMYHFAYDASYLLLIAGVVMLLHAVIRHRPRKTLLMLGSFISSVPMITLMIF